MNKSENSGCFLWVIGIIAVMVYSLITEPQLQNAAANATGIHNLSELIPLVLGIAAIIAAIWVVYKIATSEIAIPFFTLIVLIGIILGASYLFAYGDKDSDGKEDAQIIKVVQPGGNPDLDAQYTAINRENTKSNFLSMAGISLYIIVLVIAFVAITGVGVVLHTLIRNRKDGFTK
jgi:hypothetical protein